MRTSPSRGATSSRIGHGIFPKQFEFIEVKGAESYFTQIAFGSVVDPLRPWAKKAFDEFFFSRARSVYPQYDFARMNDNEYGATSSMALTGKNAKTARQWQLKRRVCKGTADFSQVHRTGAR